MTWRWCGMKNSQNREIELTAEDEFAWRNMTKWMHNRARLWVVLRSMSELSDRRDAALMLDAQWIASFGPCSLELHGIAFRGWDQAEDGQLRWL